MTTTSRSLLQTHGIDAGLLVLRIGAGVSLLLLFGLQKLHDGWAFLHTGQWQFVDFNRKMGLPAPALVASLQTLNESIGALLLACGYLTRFAAASLAFGFAVATYCSLKAAEAAWMMAGYFFIMFTTLLLAGPGKFSIDYLLETKARAHSHDTVQK
jgi:putative oxidoreductase